MPTNYLEGIPEKSIFCNFTTNVSAWSLLNATGSLSGTVFYGQMKQKFSLVATNTRGGFGVKTRRPILKKTCMYICMYLCMYVCMYDGGPENLFRVHGIMDSMKYPDILNMNLAAPARKLKLGHCWSLLLPAGQWFKTYVQINTKMVNWTQKPSFCHGHYSPLTKTCELNWRGECTREDLGLWMIWRDGVKRNGLRFLSLYSKTLLEF